MYTTLINGRVCVVTSWDDADKFTWKLIDYLEKYEIEATFFVPIKPTKYGRLSDEEIADIARIYEVGGHGITHSVLTKLPIYVARKEIRECKQVLEKICKNTVYCFSYPKGKLNEDLIQAVKDAGYVAARVTKPYNILKSHNLFALPVTIQAHHQNIGFNCFHLARIGPDLAYLLFKEKKEWDKIAKKLFDMCLEKGGVFHLWGHAWELEKENGWEKLESLLSYIAFRKNVLYLNMKDYAFKIC